MRGVKKKICFEVESCSECPFCYQYTSCTYGGGKSIIGNDVVFVGMPSWCPGITIKKVFKEEG